MTEYKGCMTASPAVCEQILRERQEALAAREHSGTGQPMTTVPVDESISGDGIGEALPLVEDKPPPKRKATREPRSRKPYGAK